MARRPRSAHAPWQPGGRPGSPGPDASVTSRRLRPSCFPFPSRACAAPIVLAFRWGKGKGRGEPYEGGVRPRAPGSRPNGRRSGPGRGRRGRKVVTAQPGRRAEAGAEASSPEVPRSATPPPCVRPRECCPAERRGELNCGSLGGPGWTRGGGRPLWAGAVVVVAAAATFKPVRFRRARGVSGAACAGRGARGGVLPRQNCFSPREARVRNAAADGVRSSPCFFFFFLTWRIDSSPERPGVAEVLLPSACLCPTVGRGSCPLKPVCFRWKSRI